MTEDTKALASDATDRATVIHCTMPMEHVVMVRHCATCETRQHCDHAPADAPCLAA